MGESKIMNDFERQKGLFCTPPHIVRALLDREKFPGLVWEPAVGKGHIVKVLLEYGYRDVLASDIFDWGFPCKIEDFLESTNRVGSIITNPLFDIKWEFLAQAKKLAEAKIALRCPSIASTAVPFFAITNSTSNSLGKRCMRLCRVFRGPTSMAVGDGSSLAGMFLNAAIAGQFCGKRSRLTACHGRPEALQLRQSQSSLLLLTRPTYQSARRRS